MAARQGDAAAELAVTTPGRPDDAPYDVGSYAEAAAWADRNRAAASVTRARLTAAPGGLEGFRNGLLVSELDLEAGELDPFHAVLRSSILPDELVPPAHFVAALGPKNADPAFARAIGPYRYFALTLQAPDVGIVGAAGFVTFCHKEGPATLHASYYALLPAFRGLGLAGLLLDAVSRTAVQFIAAARPAALATGYAVQFIEANDFATMSLRNRLADEALAMHPLARDAMWERVGFREILDVNYHQRDTPPMPLALKAALVDFAADGPSWRAIGLRAPETVAGDIVLRHVTAFDGLLMNYDMASRALATGRQLPHPETADLIAAIAPAATLPVRPVLAAVEARHRWATLDDALARRGAPPLDAVMQSFFYDNDTGQVSGPNRG